ncbi:hypothetical protein LCGC14_0839620 [marine sediment metagenome]|uniref:Uncharacterized protein n=1 Tax=marine sediment metagenome TaxID=412755 RepID=A0A0F9PIA3_9ZZZZ
MLVIVPNELHDLICARIDAQLKLVPEAAPDRECYYAALLSYFDEHGRVPEFCITPKQAATKQAKGGDDD